jgi:hypothetical protein
MAAYRIVRDDLASQAAVGLPEPFRPARAPFGDYLSDEFSLCMEKRL